MTETQEQDPSNVHAKVGIIRYKDWTYAAYTAPSDCPNEEVRERGVRLTDSEESDLYGLFFQVGMSLKNYSKSHSCLPQWSRQSAPRSASSRELSRITPPTSPRPTGATAPPGWEGIN